MLSSINSDPAHRALGRVAVIGGGIGGLAASHYLLAAGAQVTLFEATNQLGGLGTFFQTGDLDLERFYHVMLPTDVHLLELLDQLELSHLPYWAPSSFAMMNRGVTYPLNGPFDLLRFRPVSFLDRLRLGWTGIYGKLVRDGDRLDQITAAEWLTRLSGPRAFDRFWRPLLEAKFGDAYDQIPAAWYWGRFRRESPSGKEMKGYPRGGYRKLTESIAAQLVTRGAELRLSSPVNSVDVDGRNGATIETVSGTHRYDRIVSTVPMVLLRKIAGAGLQPWMDRLGEAVDYQGVVNVVLLLDQSVIDHYWVAVVDSQAPFQGIVETTNIRSLKETQGTHIVYLLNYAHRDDPLFSRDSQSIQEDYVAAFLRLFQHVPKSSIKETFVFRTPFVEPIYSPGYASRRPPIELVPDTIYLSTTAQIYPEVTSWNSVTGQARKTVRAMQREAPER